MVERDGVSGNELLHSVLPRFIRVAPATGDVRESGVLAGGDWRSRLVSLGKSSVGAGNKGITNSAF